MRVAVFGASGGIGQHLVREAVAAGYDTLAITRGPPLPAHQGAEHLVGDVLDATFVRDALIGCDAVLSALGIQRAVPANPWSALASPPDFSSRSAAVITAAMTANAIARIIAVSAAGVGPDERNPALSLLRTTTQLGPMYVDLARMESVYARSGLDWQCVRPVVLTNGARTTPARVVQRFGLVATVRRANVAAFMVGQLAAPAPLTRTPMLA